VTFANPAYQATANVPALRDPGNFPLVRGRHRVSGDSYPVSGPTTSTFDDKLRLRRHERRFSSLAGPHACITTNCGSCKRVWSLTLASFTPKSLAL